MPRFQRHISCDNGYPDGQIFISALDFTVPAAAQGGIVTVPTYTNTTPFTEYIQVPASTAAGTIHFPLSKFLFRLGMQDGLQEQFGSSFGGAQGMAVNNPITWTTSSISAGSSVSIPVANSAGFVAGNYVTVDIAGTQEKPLITSVPDSTHIVVNTITASHSSGIQVGQNPFTTPAGVSGAPPYTGLSQLTPVTAPRPKGIQVNSISLIYQVNSVNATSQAIALYSTIYKNAAAPVSTALITSGTNGLVSTAAANPVITTIAVPTPAYLTSPFQEITVVYTPVTPSGSTINIYGIHVSVTYNFN